jgi:hypothetical protein
MSLRSERLVRRLKKCCISPPWNTFRGDSMHPQMLMQLLLGGMRLVFAQSEDIVANAEFSQGDTITAKALRRASEYGVKVPEDQRDLDWHFNAGHGRQGLGIHLVA